ncbi:DUF5677 domain-containing protein [Hydrogenophaga sp.]|uniref:DUF5677 domain-containing protein n=1 Tax=Hydrogenophaga sp. TaxID=1904254 RepID=UPI003F7175DB
MESTADPIEQDLLCIEQETRDRCVVNLNVDGTYANVLKGCYVKCFEFAVFSRSLKPNSHAYFLAPALRGICEDCIALRYLQSRKPPNERDELLMNRMLSLVFDAAAKQQAFFQKRRAFQPVFSGKLKVALPKAALPATRNMASEVGLEDVYDFMYAITSDVVHFNPRVIIRNAWGKDKERFDHSVKNFDVYYADFCQTYGIYFLGLLARAFQAELGFSATYMSTVAKLEAWLDEKLRWPEAVTFEEMNIKGPSEVLRIVMKLASQSTGGKAA